MVFKKNKFCKKKSNFTLKVSLAPLFNSNVRKEYISVNILQIKRYIRNKIKNDVFK